MKKCEIVKLEPLGFCFGVVRALNFVKESISNNSKPIYLIGNLVHNRFVSEYLKDLGIIIKDEINKEKIIDEINDGTVIFTAHGISKAIKDKAIQKKLNVIDTTCPFVNKSFALILEKINDNYEVLYLGKKNHPETIAALSLSPKVHLIESSDDLDKLFPLTGKVALTNQTTMSPLDLDLIKSIALKKFPQLNLIKKTCFATNERQEILRQVALKAKNEGQVAFIVIGDKTSNNTKKLTETASSLSGKDVFQVETLNDLPFNKLKFYKKIYLTSGTSTPYAIVEEIYEYLIKGEFVSTKSQLQLKDYIK